MEPVLSLEDNIYASIDDRKLNLIILPTEKCNFRCFYCYEDFKIGRMPRAVIDGIKKLILSRLPDLETLELSWFGGEPLMAKDIIYEIHDFVNDNSCVNMNLSASITTNAYLLDAQTLENLVNRKVKLFQISIDGDEEQHNITRHLSNNQPTFHNIWNNLLAMKQSSCDFTTVLRVHFTYENYNKLYTLIDKINQNFSTDDRFKIYFKAIERLGGANDEHIIKFSYNEKIKIKQNLDAMLINKNQVYNLETKDKPYICYASKANSFVIRADGRVGKCTVALNDERNNIGLLNDQGELTINDNFYHWIKGIDTLDKQMLACPLSKLNNLIKASDK